MELAVKITDVNSGCFRAGERTAPPEGGFTVHRTHIKDGGVRPRITFPLSQRLHPYVTLRGALKQAVYNAIGAAYLGHKGLARPDPEAVP